MATKDKLDLEKDWLAGASLTDEQRKVWESARAELLASRSQLREMEAKLRASENKDDGEKPSNYVVLTRPDFNREVSRMLAFDERYGGTSSIVYFDIENLAEIITAYGRSVANSAIRSACDALVKNVRGSDIVGRLDVNELGVFLARCDNATAWKKAEAMASRLLAVMASANGKDLNPRINFGAYTFKHSEDLSTGMVRLAESLTRAKPVG